MTKVNVVSQKENEQQLADILLLLVSIQGLVALEFVSNVGQLLVNPLYFGFFTLAFKKSLFTKIIRSKSFHNSLCDLQLRISDIKTAKPLIPSPRTAGIVVKSVQCWVGAAAE